MGEARKVLPFDEKPQGVRHHGQPGEFASMAPGVDDMWQIQSLDMRYQAQIMKFSGSTAAEQRKSLAAGDLGADARARLGPIGVSRWNARDGRRAGPCAAVDPLPVVEKDADAPPTPRRSRRPGREAGIAAAMRWRSSSASHDPISAAKASRRAES